MAYRTPTTPPANPTNPPAESQAQTAAQAAEVERYEAAGLLDGFPADVGKKKGATGFERETALLYDIPAGKVAKFYLKATPFKSFAAAVRAAARHMGRVATIKRGNSDREGQTLALVGWEVAPPKEPKTSAAK